MTGTHRFLPLLTLLLALLVLLLGLDRLGALGGTRLLQDAEGEVPLPPAKAAQSDPEAYGLDYVRRVSTIGPNLELKEYSLLRSFQLANGQKLVVGTGEDVQNLPKFLIARMVRTDGDNWEVIDSADMCVPDSSYAVLYPLAKEDPVLFAVGVERDTSIRLGNRMVAVPASKEPVSMIPLEAAPEHPEVFPLSKAAENSYTRCLNNTVKR